MGKILHLFLIFFLVQQSFSQVERDKALHFIGGNLYGLAGAGIAKQISDGNRWWTFAGSIGGATLIGLGKEAVDAGQRENGWDNEDLLATILGGATVGITIDLFTDNKKKQQKKRKGSLAVLKNKDEHDQLSKLELLLKNQHVPTLSSLALPNSILE